MITPVSLQALIKRLRSKFPVLEDTKVDATEAQRAAIANALTILADREADARSDADAASGITNLAQAKIAIERLNQRQAVALEAIQRVIKFVAPK